MRVFRHRLLSPGLFRCVSKYLIRRHRAAFVTQPLKSGLAQRLAHKSLVLAEIEALEACRGCSQGISSAEQSGRALP